MTNRILNEKVSEGAIAKVALAQLENDLVLGNLITTDLSSEYAEVGDTVNIRRPQKFEGQADNLDLSSYNEDINEGKVPVVMNRTFSVKFTLDSKEMTLDVGAYNERWIKPAITKMRDFVEGEIAQLYTEVSTFTGTPGTKPSTFAELGGVSNLMTYNAVPMSPRRAVHDPDVALKLADGLKGVYVQDKAKSAFEEARIGRYARFDNYESVHIFKHTVGDYGGTPLVNGASQASTYTATRDTNKQNLVTDGWTASKTGLLKKGDIITIAGVYAVNPISRQSTGNLKTFVVTADCDSDGSGNATLSITPPIITSGAFQTVSGAPADNAAITVKTGTAKAQYAQSLCFHPSAFTLVTRPLKKLDSATWSKTYAGNKMTITGLKYFNGDTRKEMLRLDILFGLKTTYEEMAARLTA